MSNIPINEETLILYYYNDGLTGSERRAIQTALRNDAALQQKYQALVADLDALGEPQEVPVPEGFEYRLQSALAREARLEQAHAEKAGWLQRLFTSRQLATGTALASVLAVGIGIGVWLAGGEDPAPRVVMEKPPVAGTAEWSPVAFQRGLESHFRSGRSTLASLSEGGQQDREALVSALITQNRLFARLAVENDSPELARVLRAFETTLLELASEDLSPEAAAALKDQLEFEFQVMLTKMGRDSSQQTEPQTQEIEL